MKDQTHAALSEEQFVRLINTAFKSYDSLLDLARLPLAHMDLIKPALVLDEFAPTLDERGRAVRTVLQWAVNGLSPAPPICPLGRERPFDDPTWTDPLWWGYNILRHRYLEPLAPDAREVLGSGGFTEALIALTGISTPDRFFEERNRAIREVSRLLYEQYEARRYSADIQRLAVDKVVQALKTHPPAWRLAELSAIFKGGFPRPLLLDLASAEDLPDYSQALRYLTSQRILQEGDAGARLWMSPVIQEAIHAQQPRVKLISRHRRAITGHYRTQMQPLQLAWHLRVASDFDEAASVLLRVAGDLIGELQIEELRAALEAFQQGQLRPYHWFQVQLLLGDVYRKLGLREDALAACRAALKATDRRGEQARVYRRLGKLYENYNQWRALDYYQRAIERFPPDDPELVDVLKDRAWQYIHSQIWDKAEADLLQTLELVGPDAWQQRADVYNALASLYRQQQTYDRALDYARRALVLREENGDLQLIAESWSNIGLIHAWMGETNAALTAHQEALDTFRKLDNRSAIGTVLTNVGMAYQLAGQLRKAVDAYRRSLAIFEEIEMPMGQSTACYNLAETFATLGDRKAAQEYWQRGYTLSTNSGLEGELKWYEELRATTPALCEIAPAEVGPPAPTADLPRRDLCPVEQAALSIARKEGFVTAKKLVQASGKSKSTATRKLSRLVEVGLLIRKGKGRGVHYTPV